MFPLVENQMGKILGHGNDMDTGNIQRFGRDNDPCYDSKFKVYLWEGLSKRLIRLLHPSLIGS